MSLTKTLPEKLYDLFIRSIGLILFLLLWETAPGLAGCGQATLPRLHRYSGPCTF
jgi:hypothetical protein